MSAQVQYDQPLPTLSSFVVNMKRKFVSLKISFSYRAKQKKLQKKKELYDKNA
jgi:hypothetical protein